MPGGKPVKPYTSRKQRAWAHTTTGEAALGSADVAAKDKASKGMKLPLRSRRSAGKGNR